MQDAKESGQRQKLVHDVEHTLVSYAGCGRQMHIVDITRYCWIRDPDTKWSLAPTSMSSSAAAPCEAAGAERDAGAAAAASAAPRALSCTPGHPAAAVDSMTCAPRHHSWPQRAPDLPRLALPSR